MYLLPFNAMVRVTALVMTLGAALLSLPLQGQDALVVHIGGAIAHLEGYRIKASATRRANNPGAISPRGKLLKFPNAAAGWNALYRAVDLKLSQGLTLRQLADRWAEDPTYAVKLGRLTGLPLDTRLR